MLKLIVGRKGSGKTKTLIDLVNSTVESTDGAVVCIERGDKLVHAVKYQARLADTDEYGIDDWRELYGFIAGFVAGNHDAKDIFVDSVLKILGDRVEDLLSFVRAIVPLADTHALRLTMTVSLDRAALPPELEQYC